MSSNSSKPQTKIVCECREIDEDGTVLRTFPMGSNCEKAKRTRRGVSTWNEQLKVVTALMKEVLGSEPAESGLQLKLAGYLKDKGMIENPTRETVREALQSIRGKPSAKANSPKEEPPSPPPPASTPSPSSKKPEPQEVELVSEPESESESTPSAASSSTAPAARSFSNISTEIPIQRSAQRKSRRKSRMQRQGGGGCGCAGGADMMMKGGGGCGMWPASGGKRRKASKKTRKGKRKSRKGTRKSRKSWN